MKILTLARKPIFLWISLLFCFGLPLWAGMGAGVVFARTPLSGEVLPQTEAGPIEYTLCAAVVQDAAPTGGPVISANKEGFDFGELLSGEVRIDKVRIENSGNADLIVHRIEFSCGCSVPRVLLSTGETVSLKEFKTGTRTLVLAPGTWAQMELEFSSLGRKGKVNYKMVIHTNDPSRPAFLIPIKAKIRQAFKLSPKTVAFGRLAKHTRATRKVTVLPAFAGEFRITGFTNLPPYMAWEAHPIEGTRIHAFDLQLTLKEDAPAGEQILVLKAVIDSQRTQGLAIPVSFTVLPEISFTLDGEEIKKKVNFGVIEKGKGAVKRVHILNGNPAVPYVITDCRFTSRFKDHLEVRLDTLRPGIEYELVITLNPGLDTRLFTGVIHLMSKHPDMKLKKLDIKGIFR